MPHPIVHEYDTANDSKTQTKSTDTTTHLDTSVAKRRLCDKTAVLCVQIAGTNMAKSIGIATNDIHKSIVKAWPIP